MWARGNQVGGGSEKISCYNCIFASTPRPRRGKKTMQCAFFVSVEWQREQKSHDKMENCHKGEHSRIIGKSLEKPEEKSMMSGCKSRRETFDRPSKPFRFLRMIKYSTCIPQTVWWKKRLRVFEDTHFPVDCLSDPIEDRKNQECNKKAVRVLRLQ